MFALMGIFSPLALVLAVFRIGISGFHSWFGQTLQRMGELKSCSSANFGEPLKVRIRLAIQIEKACPFYSAPSHFLS